MGGGSIHVSAPVVVLEDAGETVTGRFGGGVSIDVKVEVGDDVDFV